LFDAPGLATGNLQAAFDTFPWKHDAKALSAWQRGRTSYYPIVDVGMCQLWRTGVMHNRVRRVVASFLVKHLPIDWREGERWFWDTLVDADAGSHPANWQWVAGCGVDAAPYFRVFNPVLKGEKFDPDGAYVRRWVSELGELPGPLIHQPWQALPLELTSAGVELGASYPEPIITDEAANAHSPPTQSFAKAEIQVLLFDSSVNPAIVITLKPLGDHMDTENTGMESTPEPMSAPAPMPAPAMPARKKAKKAKKAVKKAAKKTAKKSAKKAAKKASKKAKKAVKKTAKKAAKKKRKAKKSKR
jgi:hypothetical protein